MSTSTYVGTRAPRGKGKALNTVAGFKHKKEDGWFYHVAEKLNQAVGNPDMEAAAAELGYELVEDGPRKSLWRMPLSDHNEIEKGYRDVGNARLRAKTKMDIDRSGTTESGDSVSYEETTNKAEVREMSAQELVAGMRD